MPRIKSLVGRRFGSLRVVSLHGRVLSGTQRRTVWDCVCDCGGTARAQGGHLLGGTTKSCGCLRKSWLSLTTHGLASSPHYATWASMFRRCENPQDKDFHRYGGRGIAVDSAWRDVRVFASDMGPRPPGHTLERVDNNKSYGPDNCVWASKKRQARNRSTARLIAIGGVVKSVTEWAEEACINRNTVFARLRKGVSGPALIQST